LNDAARSGLLPRSMTCRGRDSKRTSMSSLILGVREKDARTHLTAEGRDEKVGREAPGAVV
jgi:hypothetical protein